MAQNKRKSSTGRFVTIREAQRKKGAVLVETIPKAGEGGTRTAYRDASTGQFIASDALMKKIRNRNKKAREILKDR